MSGVIVERRDHVLMTLRSPDCVHALDLHPQVLVDERALLQAARHRAATSGCRGCGDDERSSGRTSCPSCGCGPRACPTATPGGDHPSSCPRHHRAGGRPGSWRRHARAGACPSSGCGRPCRSRSSAASALPTEPTVARQSIGTRRISVDGRRSVANWPSLATSWIAAPAPRPILPPAPGLSSTLCTDGTDRDVAQRQRVAGADLRALAALQHVADRRRRSGRGCSASRRRGSGAARCARCGSGRTRWPRPSPGTPSLFATEVDRRGTGACGRHRGGATSSGRRSCDRRCAAWA